VNQKSAKWQTKKLGDVCSLIGGGTPSKSREEFYKGDIPWATIRDMNTDLITQTEFKITPDAVSGSSTNVIKEGNVVIATRVGLGKICLIDQDTAINQDLRGIIPLDPAKLLVPFLFWWFKSIAKTIVDEGTGATVQGVKLTFVKSLEIPLPPLPEQKRIVAILDEAFAGIRQAVSNAEKNLANARELFESYLNKVFTEKGEGWVEKELGKVCVFQGGSQPPKSVFSAELLDNYIRLIQIRDYKSDKHIVYIPKDKAKRFCSADDVMIGRYGPPLFQILRGINGAYNVALMKAQPKEDSISKDYLYFFLKNRNILQHIIKASNRAAGQIGIKKDILESYPIPFPKNSVEQAELVIALERTQRKVSQLEAIYKQKLTALSELKQSILQKAFSGELTANTKPQQANR